MKRLIFANSQHEILISRFINLTEEFVKDISSKTKFESYQEIQEIIFDYHNTYGESVERQNWYDWIMILPINISVMTNGFMAGIENSKNRAKVNSYRTLLVNLLEETVISIDKMEYKNE